MVSRQRPERIVTLLAHEAEIFDVLLEKSPCSSIEINDRLLRPNLLETMRTVHALEAKGIFERVLVNGRKLFRVRTYGQRIKVVIAQGETKGVLAIK